MSTHPYPEHVVEAVAEAMGRSRTGEDWGRFQDYFIEHTHVALQALWDASRVDTVEQLVELPDTYYVIDANGYWGDKSNYMQNDDPSEFPMHVIYWGDRDA